eukprot:182983_1
MSTGVEGNSKWNTLESFPFKRFSQQCVISNDEFVVASSNNNIISDDCNGDGIYKFNIHKNKWIKIFDYDSNFKCIILSATYDNKHKLLYCCDYPSKLLTFDLNTKSEVTSM